MSADVQKQEQKKGSAASAPTGDAPVPNAAKEEAREAAAKKGSGPKVAVVRVPVGKRTPRVDGRLKVTGAARYTADIRLPGMLFASMITSPHAHARILSID